MGNLEGVKAGDELLRTRRLGGKKRDQEPRVVRVHKVGTKLVHVLKYPNEPNGPTDTYRIANGTGTDGFTDLWKREEWEAERRRDELEDALRKAGVEVWRGGPKPIAVLEALWGVMERAERGEIK